jgi:2-oxoisovalerate dehydrogenase E2 component (dihydrolipoyl transacylase)
MSTFHLPDVGEGLQEAEIVAWHVGVGDHVVADQPLVSIETDKAVVEIPSPRSGHIAALHGEPGDVIDVGAALVEFADARPADAGAIVGALPSTPAAPDDASASEPSVPPGARGAAVRAAPAVRALASSLGVDLAGVEPTGPERTVTRADVRAAADGGATDDRGVPIQPLRGVRRAMDANMTRAGRLVVPATVTDDVDIGDWAPGTDVTVRLLRALARACVAEPALNAVYLGRDRGRQLHGPVDVGIAVDTDDGLFVPVLRDVANRAPEDLRHGLDAMRADIEARTVPPEHLEGATISLSNFGMFGGRYAALVVVPPQVAIVGAGRARDAAVVRHRRVVARRLLPLSLTFDHRVVTGAEAARFLDALGNDLEEAE